MRRKYKESRRGNEQVNKKNEDILRMSQIVKIFPGVKALDHVDFCVRRGEVHCLLGQMEQENLH